MRIPNGNAMRRNEEKEEEEEGKDGNKKEVCRQSTEEDLG